MAFEHQSVLLNETVAAVFTRPDGIYLDGTLGGGTHSALLLSWLAADGRLIGLDRDETAVAHSAARYAADQRVTVKRANFADLALVLSELGLSAVTGVMLDLGLSSPQIDDAGRGFSYMRDAPLDMRADRRQPLTAEMIVNDWSREELTALIRAYGEEKWAARIAGFITEARGRERITTTGGLVALIKEAIPAAARREGPHPAKRTFQALRMAVNREMENLSNFLNSVLPLLETGGRLAVLTYHSLEDRAVKQCFQAWQGRCTCPPGLPVCACGARAAVRVLTGKPITPSAAELSANPKSRSAKLRAAEKLQTS
jgi:16S rRNA (cytosine1402-N4)-methyltransferase